MFLKMKNLDLNYVRRREYINNFYGLKNLIHISLLYITFFVFSITLVIFYNNIISYLVIFIISSIYQRFLTEWLHEGVHFNIHPNKNINEFVSKWFLGSLFGLPLDQFRESHFKHHKSKSYFHDGDTDTSYAKISSRKDLFFAILRDLFFINAVYSYLVFIFNNIFFNKTDKNPEVKSSVLSAVAPIFVMQIIFFSISIYFQEYGIWLSFYLSMLSLYPLLSRIRLYGQHLSFDNKGDVSFSTSETSRTIDGNWLDRLLFSSHLMCFHYEHHAKPSLPYRALRKIQKGSPNDPNRYLKSHWPFLKKLFALKK